MGNLDHVHDVVIRAIPEIQFVRYPQEPRHPALGEFSWDWLSTHVLGSVNTIAILPGEKTDAVIDEWTAKGRKCIGYGSVPERDGLTGQDVFQTWSTHAGFTDPRLSGILADEFKGRAYPAYAYWREAMALLTEHIRGTGKAMYAYCGGPGMYARPMTRDLVQTVLQGGSYIAWERYLHEMPTLPEGEEFMDCLLGRELVKWKARFPECQRQMVQVLGIFATGPDLDVHPGVNFKVWMDMQMRYIATHPEYEGLFGVQWWYSGMASEELLRWESALYRHYCIQGNTELLSNPLGWSYELTHIENPDFEEGCAGWTIESTGTSECVAPYMERYARAENRYWHREQEPDAPSGNRALWMRRVQGSAGRVWQTVRRLTPGKLYSAQMIVADKRDIEAGLSREQRLAASLQIEGAEVLPDGGYQSIPVSSPWSHEQLPFKNGPAWFNHFRVLFRATAETARIEISVQGANGESDPVGQDLLINYVQVQPYFEE